MFQKFFKWIDFENTFLENLAIVIIILILAYVVSWLMRRILDQLIRPALETLSVDPTKFNFFKNAVSFVIYTFATIQIFYTIPPLRSIGATLFAGAGILAAIVGFASQQALSNIISGLFIVFFKPFRVGDFIKINSDTYGTVEDITLRHVVIIGPENRRIVIPNSIISTQTIINSTLVEEKTCAQIEVTLSHEASVEQAMKIMQEEAEKNPHCLDNRSEEDKRNNLPIVVVRLVELKNEGYTLRANVWTKDPSIAFATKCDLLKIYKECFDREKLSFPSAGTQVSVNLGDKSGVGGVM